MLGGDIHIGVTSQIHDKKTDLTLTHLTTSPITNHVTKGGAHLIRLRS